MSAAGVGGGVPAADRRRWIFGPAMFDERSFELRVNGQEVELERKALEVLRLLLHRAGEVVTKDDLLQGVWPGRILSESVLAGCVSRVRDALGDETQALIRTVHGYGYRLVAPVRIEARGAAGQPRRALRMLLVEDHELFRAGIKLLLADLAESVTFAEASNCRDALALAGQERFDVVLLDFHLPGLQGREALRALRAAMKESTIVVLSSEEDPAMIRQIVEDGAAGFIPKASSHAVMLAALELVLAGGTYLPPNALFGLHGTDRPADGVKDPGLLDNLTQRQFDILRLALQGKSSDVIAREMDLPEATVLEQLAVCYRALGVGNRADAVFAAARAGLKL